MKQLAALLLLISAPCCGIAQTKQGQARLDSLIAALPGAHTDTAAMRLLDNISFAYSFTNPDEGIRYAGKAMVLAQKICWKRGAALAYNDFGNCYLRKAAYPQALDNFYKALKLHEEAGDTQAIGKVSGNIGTVFFSQKNYPRARQYFFASLRQAQAAHDSDAELLATGNIGTVYYGEGRNSDALAYMQQALALAGARNDRRSIISQLSNIGNVYSSVGNGGEALAWYAKALAAADTLGDRQIIAANEGNIGETYLDLAKDSARGAAAKSAYLSNAVDYLRRGIADAREVGYSSAVIDFSQALSEAYALQGKAAEALKTYQQYTALKDSVFSMENNEKIAHLETARALELKDKDIRIAQLALEKKRSERWFFIAGMGVLLLIMGILFRSFRRQRHSNHLLSKEKKRSDDLLMNILPQEVAEELKDHGTSAARQYESVSVIFTDFVDFTGTAQKLPPTTLVRELHECFSAFDAIIERNGLEKIKTIGDAYMAACGLPLPDAAHARKTVQAALDIRNFIEERRKRERVFDIRIGISSGPVVAGIVGMKKFAYDIWGDTVNTAARMEQHSGAGAINISHSTYELVKEDFSCAYRGRIEAKNKGEVEMYFVVVD